MSRVGDSRSDNTHVAIYFLKSGAADLGGETQRCRAPPMAHRAFTASPGEDDLFANVNSFTCV